MGNKGSALEQLISFIESSLVPKGFAVTRGEKQFDEHGHQLAEFDVILRGPIGGGAISWLIECRDRPAGGPADGQWIQSLASRRDLFRFDKVTAVSTTGFSPAAVHAARHLNVELRTVNSVAPESFEWMLAGPMTFASRKYEVKRAKVLFHSSTPPETLAIASAAILGRKVTDPIFRLTDSSEQRSVFQIITSIVEHFGDFENVVPNTNAQSFPRVVHFTDAEPHVILPNESTNIRVLGIDYDVELSVTIVALPIVDAKEYFSQEGRKISQSVRYESMAIGGTKMAVAFHNIPDQGTHVVLHRME